MHFTFTETGVILDETEVCKFLEGWSIFVTPNKLKSAFFKTPGGDFFEILKQGPWRYDTEEVEKEFFDKIQEAAKGIGFKTTPPTPGMTRL